MNQNRLRISIIGLLAAVAIASFGCGGGSGAGPATSGGFNSAVIPGGSVSGGESENASLGGSPPNEGGEEEPGDSTASAPSNRENAPAPPVQNTQNTQQSTNNDNQEVIFPYGIQDEGLPLPPGHGLEKGLYKVSPGNSRIRNFAVSEEYGDIVTTCPFESGFCFIKVGADGTATYLATELGLTLAGFDPEILPRFQPSETPLPRSVDAAQAPVLDFVDFLHVGADVAPRADELTPGIDRSGVSVSSGEVQDGIETERLLEFMNQHASLENKLARTGIGGAPGLETYPEPPTIRLAEGTSDLYARFAAHAVQLINSALPFEKRITLGAGTLPAGTELGDVPEGEILLEFGSLSGGALGSARLLSNFILDPVTDEPQKIQEAAKAHVTINEEIMRQTWVHKPTPGDPYGWALEYLDSRVKNTDKFIKLYNDRIFLSVVVHELMHALGFYHIDESRFTESIMHSTINNGQANVNTPNIDGTILIFGASATGQAPTNQSDSNQFQGALITSSDEKAAYQPTPYVNQGTLATARARTVPGHILFPIDRAALQAAYARFDPGAQPDELTAENLGAWTDTSFHLRGNMDFPGGGASFGVASSNGLIQPWATGPTPWTNLGDSQTLSGSATWSGALLGITASSETVAGDASLSVNLSSLNGGLAFTNMEKWGVNEAPGAVGSGTTWGDGDLGYTIGVTGNTFIQTGGDDGYVTGAFFGAAHEAMGGVLERADLTASFGGRR